MQTALETPLNEERNNLQTRKSIQVSGFDEDTVALFVKLLQQNDDKQIDLKWKEIMNLIIFSDYYQSETVLDISVAVGSKLITVESFFEAVEVMDGCNIDAWYKPCIDLLLTSRNLAPWKADVRWKASLSEHSKVMAYIMDGVLHGVSSDQTLREVYACIRDTTCICFCRHVPTHMQVLKDFSDDYIPSGVSENGWKDLRKCFMACSCFCTCKHSPKHFNFLKGYLWWGLQILFYIVMMRQFEQVSFVLFLANPTDEQMMYKSCQLVYLSLGILFYSNLNLNFLLLLPA